MSILKLIAELGMNAAGFHQGLKESEKQATSFGDKLHGLLGKKVQSALGGAGALVAFKKLISETSTLADRAKEIKHGSERLGITTDTFQNLSKAAEQSGSSIESVYTAFKKIAVGQVDALDGNKELLASFQSLGITVRDLKTQKPEDIFFKIAQNLKGRDIDSNKLAALIKTMGRGADELLPGMKSGAYLGADTTSLSAEQIETLNKFRSNLNVYKKAWKVIKEQFIADSAREDDGLLTRAFSWGAKKLRKAMGMESYADEKKAGALPKVTVDDLEKQDRIKKAQDKLTEDLKKFQYEQLTNEQKITALKKEQADIQKKMAKETDQEKRLELGEKLLSVDQALYQLGGSKSKVTGGVSDSLAKVGGLYLGSDNAMVSIGKAQLRQLQAIAENTKEKGKAIALDNLPL